MRYVNIKTGATIDTDCVIEGGNWVKHPVKKEPEKKQTRKKPVKKEEVK